MIVPNKIISFENSIINRMLIILEMLRINKNYRVADLFVELGPEFEGIDEFIYSLDVLFLLDVIDLDTDSGVIQYVKTDSM
ncbi:MULTISPECIES: ABC-three component system middle component 7 [Paenibacillus]|uniref:Dynactin complex subunit n=1 Tax=Paenibacillus lactis TaxID=228574 RepID=A0ABS4F536_9BACL|nr:ABC-three component system middle component 7 [Paenibacillus lactis]MBP1891369.1 dynactin complex subunit [Paenibacillus lactis]MCM3493807.1 hypothetical protein [Paenibacillus lactis]HAF98259.1 hypothetical protein [Paenibacillus lactis]